MALNAKIFFICSPYFALDAEIDGHLSQRQVLEKRTARKRLSRDSSQSTECFDSENMIRRNVLTSFA